MNGVLSPIQGRFGAKAISAIRLTATSATSVECQVVDEDVLTIDIEEVGTYALMWTPTEENNQAVGYTVEDGVLADTGRVPESLALSAGFAFTEGIVDRLTDIAHMSVCPERPDVVRMCLTNPAGVAVRRRNVVMNSSCGVCGGESAFRTVSLQVSVWATSCVCRWPISIWCVRRWDSTRTSLGAPAAPMPRRSSMVT